MLPGLEKETSQPNWFWTPLALSALTKTMAIHLTGILFFHFISEANICLYDHHGLYGFIKMFLSDFIGLNSYIQMYFQFENRRLIFFQ